MPQFDIATIIPLVLHFISHDVVVFFSVLQVFGTGARSIRNKNCCNILAGITDLQSHFK
jgi:hypothetical protein